MQNRIYTVIDKSLFYDPDSILIGVFEFLEINGDDTRKTFEKLKDFYPHAHFDERIYSEAGGIKSVSVYRRQGRGDRDIRELKSILALLKRNDTEVRSGRMYCFSEGSGQNQIDAFLKENVNVYVYICEVAGKPCEALSAQENPTIENFCMATYTELVRMRKKFDLKMAIDDLMCVQNYFISESREPSLVEIKIIDNFFLENFRHTTFETILDSVETEDEAVAGAWEHYRELRKNRAPSLSDITKAAKESITKENIVKASAKLNGVRVPVAEGDDGLLLLCKNESHNRSTTAVPYDGASGCIGGAVKALICALGYPYDSYRVVGCGKNDKCRKNSIVSAMGYTETASAVGVSLSKCHEDISHNHDDKQREICTVLAVTKEANVKLLSEKYPQPGDKIYVIGGKTGADGSYCIYTNLHSEDSVGEYVPVTRTAELSALKRLFVSQKFADMAVAINSIGSGGVICALGEIAEGADINTGAMQTKYKLSLAEAVLSESEGRMIVCVRAESGAGLEALCKKEGLGYAEIGRVNDDKRFVIYDNDENRIASLTRTFLLYGGAEKHLSATVRTEDEFPISEALIAAKAPLGSVNPIKKLFGKKVKYDFEKACLISAADIEISKTELTHRYTPCASGDLTAAAAPLKKDISFCRMSYNGTQVKGKDGRALYSALSCGTANGIGERLPYSGAYLSIVEAVLKLACAGYGEEDINLSLQEYFPEHKNNSTRLGISVASMLGCFEAQMQLGIPSIGGRISIGGGESDREKISIVSAFAFCICKNDGVIGKALTKQGRKLILITPSTEREELLPSGDSVKELIRTVNSLKNSGVLKSAAVVNAKAPATVLMEMCKAGKKGVEFDPDCSIDNIFGYSYASVICEISAKADIPKGAVLLGYTASEYRMSRAEDVFELAGVLGAEEKSVIKGSDFKRYLYLKKADSGYGSVKPVDGARVRVLMPLTDSSVMQDDVKAAFEARGAKVKLLSVNEGSLSELSKQIKQADIAWFSDAIGSNAFLNALLADKKIRGELDALVQRGGLIYGQGSSFETLVRCGLLELDAEKLSFANTEYISQPVTLRACSAMSPFAGKTDIGTDYKCYVQGSRLKLTCTPEYADELAKNGRILTQYTQNSNACACDAGIDSVCSANGRVMGGLSRAFGDNNAYPIVEGAMEYFLNYGKA